MSQSSRVASGLSLYKPLKVYGSFAAGELTLIAIKYQGSGTDPFKEHKAIMLCFLIVMFIYGAIKVIEKTFQSSIDNISSFHVYLCHVCGAVACELLLLVLVTPIQWIVINLSTIMVVALALCFCYLHALDVFSLVGTYCFGIPAETSSTTTNGEGRSEAELADLEAAA